jgi:hypothetical protein
MAKLNMTQIVNLTNIFDQANRLEHLDIETITNITNYAHKHPDMLNNKENGEKPTMSDILAYMFAEKIPGNENLVLLTQILGLLLRMQKQPGVIAMMVLAHMCRDCMSERDEAVANNLANTLRSLDRSVLDVEDKHLSEIRQTHPDKKYQCIVCKKESNVTGHYCKTCRELLLK